jgi:hypothetical protein
VGVKNEATAFSGNMSAEAREGTGGIMEGIRVVVDWTLRRNGCEDNGASSVLCLRFAGFAGGVIVSMIPRIRVLRIAASVGCPRALCVFVIAGLKELDEVTVNT